MQSLFPHYRDSIKAARASFRPAEIQGRQYSWRKDDTRLHIDAFPTSPIHGERIIRVFCNVNPHGKPRIWRVGESFNKVARRFLPSIRPPLQEALFYYIGRASQRSVAQHTTTTC